LPVIHPVIDYKYVVDKPVLGGELGFNFNLTSLSRQQASFDPINTTASLMNWCSTATADTAIKNTNNCVLRGAPGNYSRASAEAEWKKSITDPLGMLWTPFFKLRADVAQMNLANEPGVANFLDVSSTQVFRGMPTAGLEWRYPLINVQSWGTNTLEPIAQVIARPNETKVGNLPNEDAQSFVFDDGNLFRVDKFAGWDRVEGGGRANSTRAEPSTCCSGSPISCSAQTRSPPMTPPIPASTAASIRASPITSRASPINPTGS
jgi:LPS-assembly protein